MRLIWQFMSFALLSTAAFAEGDVAKGTIIGKRCIACHSVVDAKNKTAPSLVGVVGRAIGSVADFKYSPAMVEYGKANGVWDEATLDAYLADPKKTVPGNKMALGPMKKPKERADLIAYLKTLAP